VDGRNLYDPETARSAGLDYTGIGRSTRPRFNSGRNEQAPDSTAITSAVLITSWREEMVWWILIYLVGRGGQCYALTGQPTSATLPSPHSPSRVAPASPQRKPARALALAPKPGCNSKLAVTHRSHIALTMMTLNCPPLTAPTSSAYSPRLAFAAQRCNHY
jgi:hypothetical protein